MIKPSWSCFTMKVWFVKNINLETPTVYNYPPFLVAGHKMTILLIIFLEVLQYQVHCNIVVGCVHIQKIVTVTNNISPSFTVSQSPFSRQAYTLSLTHTPPTTPNNRQSIPAYLPYYCLVSEREREREANRVPYFVVCELTTSLPPSIHFCVYYLHHC